MTSMNLLESCSFAELRIMDIGSPFDSVTTCIFVPVILLNPSCPIMSPLFWLQWMTSPLIPFVTVSCQMNKLILLHMRESFAILFFAASFAVCGVQLICCRIFLAFHSTCIHKSKRRLFHWWLCGHHVLACLSWQVVEDVFVSCPIDCLKSLEIAWGLYGYSSW